MRKSKATKLAYGAVIAALYVALTAISGAFGLSGGAIQLRLSEALVVLPIFTSAAIPGLFVGCIIANILTGCALWDIILGSIATLLGAVITYAIRKYRFLSPVPPIICNTLIIPPVLTFVYGVKESLPYLMLTVGIGEILSCGVLGTLLMLALKKYEKNIFK